MFPGLELGRACEALQKPAGFALGLFLLFVVCGCTRVAAYERGRLAHPSMSTKQQRSAGQAHLYAIREGARGGEMSAGSGCGCN